MQYEKDSMARSRMMNVVVSVKDSREVSAALRGKSVAQGLALLADVKEKKRPIRYTRYNHESAGHRRGTGPGRYPLKAAVAFTELLESVRSNAEFKDLEPELLRIIHIKADMAPTPFRYGRHRGRQGKRAHIEVIVKEDEGLKKRAEKKQTVSATKQKAASQKVEAKTAPAPKPKEEPAAAPNVEEAPSTSEEDAPQNVEAPQKARAEKGAPKKDAAENADVENEPTDDAPEQKPKAGTKGENQ